MNAFVHASYAKSCAVGLYRELGVEPVFHVALYDDGGRAYCYVHPEDTDVERVAEFKHEHREL